MRISSPGQDREGGEMIEIIIGAGILIALVVACGLLDRITWFVENRTGIDQVTQIGLFLGIALFLVLSYTIGMVVTDMIERWL